MIKVIVELHPTENVLKEVYVGCAPVQLIENRKISWRAARLDLSDVAVE
jgi:hypothetical protein